MPYALARFRADDLDNVKRAFGTPEVVAMRKGGGARSWQVFCTKDDPKDFISLVEWDNLDNARTWHESKEFLEAQARGGVIGGMEIQYLEQVRRGSE